MLYRELNLFGEEVEVFYEKKKKITKGLFDDYESFVEKFDSKKTTDDCYTPPKVYECVLRYVRANCEIGNRKVIRPFYPGGDYESIDYPARCVVIDNPPFSIISKIARFYIARGIHFFLFAPHLTLFSSNLDCSAVVCGATVIYENGANVKTSFLSNMFGDIRIMGAPSLYDDLEAINEAKKVNLPNYVYPVNVLTVSMVQKFVEAGIPIIFHKDEVHHCRGIDSQKRHNKAIFGSGFLLSEKAAAEKAAAEKDNVIVWELSGREKEIIKGLK